MRKLFSKTSVGWVAVAIGVATAVTPAWAENHCGWWRLHVGLGCDGGDLRRVVADRA
jgi:hypothetical protein